MEKKVLLMIVIISAITMLVGVSFAYFIAQDVGLGESSVQTKTSSLDELLFTPGSAINIEASQQNFYDGGPDLSSSTTNVVTLNTNNTINITYCYTVDLNITKNDFVYSLNPLTPELILKVEKKVNTGAYTTIVNDLDITVQKTTVKIPTVSGGTIYKHSISEGPSKTITNTLMATITFKNLSGLQNANSNSELSAKLDLTRVDC